MPCAVAAAAAGAEAEAEAERELFTESGRYPNEQRGDGDVLRADTDRPVRPCCR